MRVIGHDGDPCPRCGQPTDICEHEHISAKQLAQPFYYSRWFNCTNPECRTKQIMPERFIVWNDNERATVLRQQRELYDLLR